MKQDFPLDDADRRILAALQRDSTLSVQALAEIAQMSPSPCWRRVKALKEAGVIRAEARRQAAVARSGKAARR